MGKQNKKTVLGNIGKLKSQNLYIFLILVVLLLILIVLLFFFSFISKNLRMTGYDVLESGLPSPDIIDDGSWEITHTTDNDYTPYIADLKDKKTTIGLIPNNGICPKDETKQLYDENNNLILDNENKEITLKCETAKCAGQNCYSITLTDAQAINIEDYIKIGLESTTYEWINSTLYIYNTDLFNKNGFEIEIYTDETKIESPDVKWIEDNPTDNKIVFYPNLSNIIYPLDSVSFKVNKFIIPKARVSINPYYSVISNWVLDFSTFESKNMIENKTIEPVYGEEDEFGFKEILGYMVSYYGLIIDLDPVMELLYTSASNLIFNNITEGSANGARIDTPVLFMDFNKAPEVLDDTTYINYSDDYVQDNSVWNNYGDAGNLKDDGMWVNGNFSGGLEFDGVDDSVNAGTDPSLDIGTNNFTLSFWVKTLDSDYNPYIHGTGWGAGQDGYQSRIVSDTAYFNLGNVTKYQHYVISGFNVDDGVWHHVVIAYNRSANNPYVYLDNVSQVGSITGDNLSEIGDITYDTNFLIGDGRLFDGIIDEFYVFNTTLNSSEISSLYSSNIVLNSTGLVSHWALNETSGLIAEDTVGTNNGTLTNYVTHNPTYNSSCTAFTGSGGCYEFDGDDDYIDTTTAVSFGTDESFTFSVWAMTNDVSGAEMIIARTQNVNEYIYLYKNDDDLIFSIRGDNGVGVTSVTQANVLSINTWYHIVGVRDVEKDTINIYVDGVNTTPVTDATTSTIDPVVRIGAGLGANFWNGSLDNIQIWDRALSSDEISALYSDASFIGKYSPSGDFKSLVFYNDTSVYWNTTLNFADSDSSGEGVNLSDPNLVSYWKLDENYLDSAGSNDGTPINGVNNATGLSSDAMMFDGVDDYILISGSVLGTSNSSSLWFKTSSSSEQAILAGFFSNNVVAIQSGKIELSNKALRTSSNYADGNWHHLVVVDNSGDIDYYVDGVNVSTETGSSGRTTGTTVIGTRFVGSYSLFFNGLINEVLIYNDTLSNAEVMDLYKTGLSQHADTNISLKTRTATSYNLTDTGLVSQWSFNGDNNGTDEMGLNDGVCDSSATCPTWGEDYGVVGGGYDFDGGDYVNMSYVKNISATTITFWLKTSKTSNRGIVGFNGISTNLGLSTISGAPLLLLATGTGIYNYQYFVDSSGYFDDSWHHWTIIITGSGINDIDNALLYIDGNSISKSGIPTKGGSPQAWGNFLIGTNSYGYENGSIDEVRIYNRSLSASEVEDLYELGENYILWNAWSGEENMQDGIANMTTEFGNFFQFQTFFETNDTEVSSYLLNHTVEFGEEATPPQVTIVSPTATTYTSSSISFEIRTNENSTCDYSVDTGVTNHSMTANTTGTGFTASQTLSNAAYTANFYCRDIAGNLNNTESVSFTVSVVAGNGGVSTTGGGGGIAPSLKFSTDVSSMQRTLALNRIEFGQVEVTNNGDVSATFTAYVEVLEDIITLEQTSLTLEPGQSGIFEFKLTPPDDTGIYTGKIIIKSGTGLKEILTTINVRTEKSLFDITLHIPKSMRTIKTSKILRAQINLLQMGLKEKMDVTLNYVIKDFDGVVHLTESETLAVLDQKSISKEFHTEELAPGDYVLGTELIYADGVAVASSQFKIEDKLGVGIEQSVLVFLVFTLLIVSILIIVAVRRHRKVLKLTKNQR